MPSAKTAILLISLLIVIALFSVATAESYSDKQIQLTTTNYNLDIRVDYEQEKMFAVCGMTLINNSESPADHVPLVLYRLMNVRSIKDSSGNPLEFSQQVVAFEDWEKFQTNHIIVTLATPLAPGEKLDIEIEYDGHLLGYAETGMLYVQDHIAEKFTLIREDCEAYPQIGYPSYSVNRAAGLSEYDYQISVTVPDSLVVANGGELLGIDDRGDSKTYHYQNILPAWRMDIAIAPYQILEEGDNRVFFFPEDSTGARRVIETLALTLKLYTEWFGPLHEQHGFSVIEIPKGFGSQADVTCIIQTAPVFKSADAAGHLYHEISHQWNVKENVDFPCRWNEGMASFLEVYTADKLSGSDQTVSAIQKNLDRLGKRMKQHPEYRNLAIVDYGRERVTGLSYSVGEIMFGLLYKLAGDEKFRQIIGEYYRTFYATGADSEEFLKLASRIAPGGPSMMLREWLMTSKPMEYAEAGKTIEEILQDYRSR